MGANLSQMVDRSSLQILRLPDAPSFFTGGLRHLTPDLVPNLKVLIMPDLPDDVSDWVADLDPQFASRLGVINQNEPSVLVNDVPIAADHVLQNRAKLWPGLRMARIPLCWWHLTNPVIGRGIDYITH